MKRRWPCLVDDDYLLDVAVEVLVSEISDELVAKGWARRITPTGDSLDQVEWTEEGLANGVESFDFNAALLARVKALPERVKALRATESAA
jgi:hypothetical protein